ncbi:tetratricopeptide repeat protein [Polymorphospora lycopeni]|uniref:Tetratricopeptide repeat protein n=1 Tax=Polymorphospora lycopeni TaxID=3140240 RepID=A0ABV5CJA9_9ACTN
MGFFLGIGVGSYDGDRHPLLRRAVPDVEALGELLGTAFTPLLVPDPDEDQVRQRLRALETTPTIGGDDALVLLWSGHGRAAPNGLRLLARDSGTSPAAGIGVDDIAGYIAVSGASQLLLILDTCFSGKALPTTEVAGKVLELVPPDGPHVWVGVLSSCHDLETAQDGLLGQRLRTLLRDGPCTPALRVRWSVHNEFIRGDDLCDAILKEWDSDRQTPQFQGRGSAWWMFHNPLYDPGAPEQVVEHLLLAARGGRPGDERSWFTGRTVEVDQVVDWIRSGKPGVYVVTGAAGTGKSAIVGRVVSLSNPDERARLLADGLEWIHADPGERSVHAHLHARGLAADRAAEVIGGQMVGRRMLAAQADRRNAPELVGQIQRFVEAGRKPPVVVVDGLDEARSAAFPLAEELLARLARHAVVVVATRDLPHPGGGIDLVASLSPAAVLDLDVEGARQRLRADLTDYVRARLAGVDSRMDPELVATHLAADVDGGQALAGSPFLLARIVTDQLRADPVDTSIGGWRDELVGSVEKALDRDLGSVSTAPVLAWADGLPAANAARLLLAALTRGYGAGLPDQEWLTVANAGRPESAWFGQDDLTWVLGQLGRYVVQDGEAGEAVYRMAHQSLADHVRPPYQAVHETPFDPDALPIAAALAERYRSLLGDGSVAVTPGYLRRYLWQHAADAGIPGLALMRELADMDRTLSSDVGMVAQAVAERFAHWGYWQEAVAPVEEAVATYRGLAAANPAFAPDLAAALDNLGNCYREVGRRLEAVAPVKEAVEISRGLAAADPVFAPYLARALSSLGGRYGDVGLRQEAVAPAEEAVALYRRLVASNPAFASDLAGALTNLGFAYREVGRWREAEATTEEAVEAYRGLAASNPAFMPNLAVVLNNLGVVIRINGRRGEAVASTAEAVEIYRGLAASNPAFESGLAMALTNLGIRYREAGRRVAAVLASAEAVELRRRLAASNPAVVSDLAGALTHLGLAYREVGRGEEAVAPVEEAVQTYRGLAASNPAFESDLAMVLTHLGAVYSEVGRRQEAVAVTEEAVRMYRRLADDTPRFVADLVL